MAKVLYVCHNHPAIHPGRVEVYAHELFRAVRDQADFDAIFVANCGPPFSERPAQQQGSRFGLMADGGSEYLFHTTPAEFDNLLGTARRKGIYIDDWRQFLEVQRPDVVHFQHTQVLGYDLLRVTRAALPNAAIVYTLHEFTPICHHNGKMVRTQQVQDAAGDLCDRASPRRCHECYPAIGAQGFFLRERLIKSALEHVDLFIVSSHFARDRYIEWGIPPDKIVCERYGRPPVPVLPDPPDAGRRRRIGFFGQLTGYNGVDVLLEAVKVLDLRGVELDLMLWGDDVGLQPQGFQIAALLDRSSDSIHLAGRYAQAELPVLISDVDWVIVPSVWWETGPMVIQDALMHRRPVICSDIGAMGEQIQDGVNGLYFRARDPNSLANAIARAVSSSELWDELRASLTEPRPMDDHVEVMTGLYNGLLDRAHLPAPL